MSLMIGAVVIVIIVAGAAFFMSGKSGAKNTAQSETQEKKGSEGKETAVVQEKQNLLISHSLQKPEKRKRKSGKCFRKCKEKGNRRKHRKNNI